MLGFAPNEVPAFEDSSVLRQIAARELGIPIERLGANGDELLDRLLRNVWEEQLRRPEAPDNDTGLVLIDAELCSNVRKALRVFEDFRGLVGSYTWNPAREVSPVEVPNPASAVLAQFGFDPRQDLGKTATQEQVEALELATRTQLGEATDLFTVEEIYEALLSPDRPLQAWRQVLPKLRAKLDPLVSECTTDEDLLRAAQSPGEPLYASGMCRIQVLGRRGLLDADDLHFAPEDLGRRIDADLRDFSTHGHSASGNRQIAVAGLR